MRLLSLRSSIVVWKIPWSQCQPARSTSTSYNLIWLHLHNCRVWHFQFGKWLWVKFELRVFRRQLSQLSLVVVAVVVDFCDWLGVGGGLGGAVRGEDEKGAVESPAQDQPPLHRDARHIVVRIQTWEVHWRKWHKISSTVNCEEDKVQRNQSTI